MAAEEGAPVGVDKHMGRTRPSEGAGERLPKFGKLGGGAHSNEARRRGGHGASQGGGAARRGAAPGEGDARHGGRQGPQGPQRHAVDEGGEEKHGGADRPERDDVGADAGAGQGGTGRCWTTTSSWYATKTSKKFAAHPRGCLRMQFSVNRLILRSGRHTRPSRLRTGLQTIISETGMSILRVRILVTNGYVSCRLWYGSTVECMSGAA